MAYREGDISLDLKPLGTGKAIRFVNDDGTVPAIESDPDNSEIKIVQIPSARGGIFSVADDFNKTFMLMGG